jgi:hypothetical protein
MARVAAAARALRIALRHYSAPFSDPREYLCYPEAGGSNQMKKDAKALDSVVRGGLESGPRRPSMAAGEGRAELVWARAIWMSASLRVQAILPQSSNELSRPAHAY